MAQVQEISIEEYQKLAKQQPCLLYDIREVDEYNREWIKGSINLPLSTFQTSNFNPNNKLAIFHCQGGNRTTQNAALFSKLNLETVYLLTGGINAWKKAGLETQQNSTAPLPLIQQVQLTIGVLILLIIALSLLIDINFIWLAAIIGVGLITAGLTGFCGLAQLLMLLPYNKKSCKVICNQGFKSS